MLSQEDQRHLTAAEGYEELGLPIDANDKLEKWELLQTVAKQLTLTVPDEPKWPLLRAYAPRRADCLEAARQILVEATKQHPQGRAAAIQSRLLPLSARRAVRDQNPHHFCIWDRPDPSHDGVG